ncbi:helix-turn-helix transcriptional regulator [Actinophytocola sediminis]
MTPALHGRAVEVRRLAALTGAGGALLLLGEAGMGKTAVLSTVDAKVAVRGMAAERDLPFGALNRLLAPLTDRFASLPADQADELRRVVGLGGVPDAFQLRCAVHRLLVGLAADGPVCCRVDDAQWLDTESLAVLAFAARRLAGHRVSMVFAARPELVRPGHDPMAEIPRMWLSPLPDEACEPLLRQWRVPAGLRAVLTEVSGGNPLDLVSLAAALTPDQVAGRAPLPEVLVGERCADYRARLGALSAGARELLVCVAAESTVELDTLLRCGGHAEVDELLAAGLLRIAGTSVRLPSKLVRGTLYQLATPGERQRAHTRLAAVLTGPLASWHLAMTIATPSPELGDELAAAAAQAQPATAASLLDRAAALTVHTGLRGARLLAAAEQAWQAGRPGSARALLSRARAAGADRARGALLLGEIELRDGEPAIATHELATAAEHLGDPDEAARAWLLAGEARRISGDLAGYRGLARRAVAGQPGSGGGGGGGAVEMMTALFVGGAATYAGRHREAGEPLRRAVALGAAAPDVAAAVWAAEAAFALGDVEHAYECASAAVSRARLGSRRSVLPWALVHLALAAIGLDRHRAAQAAAEEGLTASVASAQRNTWTEHLSLQALSAALLGDLATAQSKLDIAAPGIAERALGRPCAISSWASACLDLVADRPGDALGRLAALGAGVSGAQQAIQVLATPQWVEAAVRAEQPGRAVAVLASFDDWVRAGGSAAWLALSSRCHAMLATDLDEAEHHYRAAIARHQRAGAAMELARTQLGYANRLRRHRRTRDARALFRDALRGFRAAGADHWATRAQAGLRASGETVEAPGATLAGLTPQQAEISRLVAVGETNKEIARRLVISPRTVDHHLRNIFTALGVRSRVELAHRITTLDHH